MMDIISANDHHQFSMGRFHIILQAMEHYSRHTGIWIDQAKAIIVRLDGDKSLILPLFIRPGGKQISPKSGRPFQKQGTTVNQFFFKKILDNLPYEDQLLIIGPDQTKFYFREFISKRIPQNCQIITKVAGHMGTPEIVGTLRNYIFQTA